MMLLRKDENMIDYILMSKDLNNLSETKVMIILFSGLILCIFFGSLFTVDFYNNEKKWHNKLSWGISLFIVLFVAIFDISLISECLNKEKRIEKRYSLKAKTLEGNIETVEDEIEFFAVKDKDLYINQILNKFYKNETNLNSVEKEIMRKLVK